MKKLIIVLLALVGFTSAATSYTVNYEGAEVETSVATKQSEKKWEEVERKGFRNAFFMRATSGMSLVDIDHDSRNFTDGAMENWSGIVYDMDLSLGISFKRFCAFYVGISAAAGDGDWTHDAEGSRDDVTLVAGLEEFYFDIGVLFYPFRETPHLKELFIGFENSIGIEYGTIDDNEDYYDVINMLFIGTKVEVGYVWDVSKHTSLGLVAHWKYGWMGGTYDVSSFGLAFTVMRR